MAEYPTIGQAEVSAESAPAPCGVAFRVTVDVAKLTPEQAYKLRRRLEKLRAKKEAGTLDFGNSPFEDSESIEGKIVLTSPYVYSDHAYVSLGYLPLQAIDDTCPVALLVWWGEPEGGTSRNSKRWRQRQRTRR